jgi:hypothetical protein
MTHHFEHPPTPDDNHNLNEFEFTPEPPAVEEQELALIDLQKCFMHEWANDPNGFMVWLISQMDSHIIDSTNRLISFSLGLRHTDSALGERVQEQIVIHVQGKRFLPALTPGNSPNEQRINDYIPLVTAQNGSKKLARHLQSEHAELVEGQIQRLRELQIFCPNLDNDLMTVVPTPGKDLVLVQRSDAHVASRSEK